MTQKHGDPGRAVRGRQAPSEATAAADDNAALFGGDAGVMPGSPVGNPDVTAGPAQYQRQETAVPDLSPGAVAMLQLQKDLKLLPVQLAAIAKYDARQQ